MPFKKGHQHHAVRKARAKQIKKLEQDIAIKSGLAASGTHARKTLGLSPQVGPQLEMLLAKWCPEIFFGGARGGGKSIALLLDFLQDCGKGYAGGWKGVIFRRSYPQLKQLIEDSHRIYGKVPGAVYLKKDREWIFPGGEKLEFRFLETLEDIGNYQGFAYQWIGYDELPNWPDLEAYDAMKASLRPTTAAVACRIRATGNPGGVGHTSVKQRFIDPNPTGWTPFTDEKGERMFIPSSVWDNKILLNNDKTYIQRLEQSGPDHLVKAWLYGDWNLVLGSYFDCWDEEKNVKPLGRVPDHWFRFRSFDWGGHAPFCVQWWALSDGTSPILGHDGTYLLPYGAKVCYREWYGCDEKDFKKGLSLDNEEIAAGILKRTELSEDIAFTVTDNLPFQRRGGPTIAETFAKCGVPLQQGDTDRVSGCSAMYLAIKGGESRIPMMYFMENCVHSIRQIPLAQKDDKLIEVYLQGNDDHALDCCFSKHTLVKTKLGNMEIGDIEEGDFVLAGDGVYRPASWAGLSRNSTGVLKLTFSDGSEVVCTPDHRFMTESGWIQARYLTDAMKITTIEICQSKQSQKQSKNSTARDITSVALTFREMAAGYIGRFGNILMGQFRKVSMFITKMTTGIITCQKTWNCFPNLATYPYMVSDNQKRGSSQLKLPPLNGMARKLAGSGIRNIMKILSIFYTLGKRCFAFVAGRSSMGIMASYFARPSVEAGFIRKLNLKLGFVRYAQSLLRLTDFLSQKPVARLAPQSSWLKLVKREALGCENVYCLTEPKTSSFVLSNGAVVHNCKIAAKVREYVQKPAVSLPDEAQRLHNSIIARPTFQQIMDSHFSKIRQAKDPYGLR